MAGDANWDSVVVLVDCDGANNGAVFADARSATTLSASGGAVTATDIVKFGTAAGKFTGTDGSSGPG